ncbi:hypothetical protein AB0L57_16020 [Nocardia sp. NPDC052254]|uniref:hypothetical protein n=1 Tax=Nocardia sp. NPDC052254 TaxID=3155681 RepID=UPI00343986AF
MITVLAGVPLHPAVSAALRHAANRVAPGPVDTRALLVALIQADVAGDWSRIRLQAGDFDALAAADVADPDPGVSGGWENVPVTDSCAIALDIAGRVAGRFTLWPLPVGAVVLGLLADDSCAAARASAAMERGELLDAVQADVLGTTLDGIGTLLPALVDEARRAHHANTAPPWPNTAPAPPAAAPGPPPSGPFATGQLPYVAAEPPVGVQPFTAAVPAAAPTSRTPWRKGPLVASLAMSLVLVVIAGVLFTVGLRHDSSATAAGFGIEKLRILDTCSLLDARVVAAVGANSHVAESSSWDSCSVFPESFDVESPSLHVYAGWSSSDDDGWVVTGEKSHGFPVSRLDRKSSGFCTRRVDTAGGDGLEIGVMTLRADNSDTACAIVDKAVPLIVDRLVGAARPAEMTPDSLRTVDPCALVTPDTVRGVVGEPAGHNPPHGVHDCRVRGAQTSLLVSLGSGRRPDVRDAYQNFVPFDIAGATGYEIPANEDTGPPATIQKNEHACQVRYMHGPEPNESAEVVAVQVTEAAGVDHATACVRAKSVLAEIIPRLPRK